MTKEVEVITKYEKNKLDTYSFDGGKTWLTKEYFTHMGQAVRRIKQIESERTLLKGHFSKVAKEYGVKVRDLTEAYATSSRYNNE